MTPFEMLISFADADIIELAKGRLRNTRQLVDSEKLLVAKDQAKLALLIVLAINPKEALSHAETALIEGGVRQVPFRLKTNPSFLKASKLNPREEPPEVPEQISEKSYEEH